jgi:hypothetical protein
MRSIVFVFTVSLLVFSCTNSGKKKDVITDSTATADSLLTPPAVDTRLRDSTLLALTSDILNAFKNKRYDSLALLVHPDEGVRFSPYAFIDTANDKVISAAMVNSWTDPKKRVKILWGTVDPTDEAIKISIDNYVKKYVYDVNFLKADSVKVNSFIGGGNTMNNLLQVYEGCNFVESHFPGFDKKYEGMDWRSLRLVFKMKDGKYFLVGVVHDEWTI